ncbi:phosphoribosylformylglycinamidine synthase subunit PurQ [Bdellovibrio bacteriovorus]|uniref:phosphoribosylformylglycinamidine synthase subunit PurQ n=1 Tax=Bdellovibrio bacteriovorus TaxID=959 RepID=UPI0021D0B6F7|nr:phosphoribosylformylglycinamidine synthase subunit PurQ [Bdellovibrio bacteriovorus]UXR64575.1 phosphoribosylformylglycinamidine synthase subunit PurQ [Bdellovibrio bacteriovorus]
MSMKPKFLVLWGDGINCENETARAIELAGAEALKVHVNNLLEDPAQLEQVHALVIPGGFSFGDHLGSGQVLALKLELHLKSKLQKFVKTKPVLGICNGFQTLVKLGLLPDADFQRSCALVKNEQGHFVDRWIEVQHNEKSPCIWTKNLPKQFALPIRHGEGRFVCQDEALLGRLLANNQVTLQYSEDVNGAQARIAGICDPSGLVFALMPHPEAALHDWHLPMPGAAHGLEFFKSAVEYLRSQS